MIFDLLDGPSYGADYALPNAELYRSILEVRLSQLENRVAFLEASKPPPLEWPKIDPVEGEPS